MKHLSTLFAGIALGLVLIPLTHAAEVDTLKLDLPPPPAPLYDKLRDPIQGPARAAIQIIEYADFECPFCKEFHKTMQEIMRKNGRRVSWVYRYAPLTKSHTHAVVAAQAADCAWRQGKDKAFWRYADALFAADDLGKVNFRRLAAQQGLKPKQFTGCLQNPDLQTVMEANAANATSLEIPGTPRTYIVNRLTKKQLILDGNVDAETIQKTIAEARATSPRKP